MIALAIIFLILSAAYAGSAVRGAKSPALMLRKTLKVYLAVLFLLCVIVTVSILPVAVRLLRTRDTPVTLLWVGLACLCACAGAFGLFAVKIFREEITEFRRARAGTQKNEA
jgi:hypothetical protein